MTIKVAIAGARGRMVTTAIQAITDAPDMEVVAALDYKFEGQYIKDGAVVEEGGIPIYTSLARLADFDKPDVLLDVTDPDAVFNNAKEAISFSIRPVIGTSGLTAEEIDTLSDLAQKAQIGGIIAPNFSI